VRRWAARPAGANWGAWGDDDQRGRLNLITPERRRAAAAEVREGIAFCLSLPLDRPGGDYHALGRRPPALRAARRDGTPRFHFRPSPARTDIFCDDCVDLYTHFSTHWDALAHVGSAFDADSDGVAERRYYNGYRAEIDIIPGEQGTGALGIDNLARACMQARGVLIDLLAVFGPERRIVGYDDLMRAAERTGAAIEPGDVLCLHTGQATALLHAGADPPRDLLEDAFCHLDGCDERLLRWIDDSGVVAIAADNFAVEAVPPRFVEEGKAYERLHEHCIFKLGIHLGELWLFDELNAWLEAHGRTRFLLTAAPLNLPGAVGSPVTPIATV
jgi:kynurenine formamidase